MEKIRESSRIGQNTLAAAPIGRGGFDEVTLKHNQRESEETDAEDEDIG